MTPWTFPLVAWPCATSRASLFWTQPLTQPEFLAQLLGGDAREFVCRWSELMLHSAIEQKLVGATSEPPRLYQDPKLAFCFLVFHPHSLWEGACAFLEDTEVPLHVFLSP